MNILIVHDAVDTATYTMLEEMSLKTDWKIYITYSDDAQAIKGKCIGLELPHIRSKFTWAAIVQLRKYIKKYHINLCYSHSTSGLSNALFASWGMKTIQVGYRGTQAKIRRLDPTYYLGLLHPKVTHIVCETPDIKTYLSQYIRPQKLSVATKPFSLSWVADAVEHPTQVEDIPDEAFKCIYIGACKGRPFKGLRHLIEAFKGLEGTEAYLTIIGSYDEEDKVLAHHTPWGTQHIHFLGQRYDAIHFLPLQNLFILPSKRDASPRVVREAMACGVPCIVTNIPGARDLIVEGQTGLLVSPTDTQEMTKAIQQLMNNPQQLEKMKAACIPHILSHFSPSNYTDYFIQLFKDLYQH